TAMLRDGGSITYAELNVRSTRVAQALRASGVDAGDRVAMIDKNSAEQFELFFGAAKLGAIPAPVSFRLSAPEIRAVLDDAQPAVWVVGPEFAAFADLAGAGATVLSIGADGPGQRYDEWRDAHPADDLQFAAAPGDTAFLLYSSGTTGSPKGIEISHANVDSSFTIYRSLMGLDERAAVLVALPLFHVGGTGWALVGFIEGATNVIVRDIVPAPLAELMEREQITDAALVPAVLQFMLQVPGIEERDFSALRAILYGAAPISEPVLREALRVFGCDFYQAYGLSETSGTTVLLAAADHDPDGPHQQRLRSGGVPVPGHEAKVVNPVTGEQVETGEVGEILLRGPNVMKGYWGRPDLTAAAVVDGWFRTGDAGYLDADGYVYLHDRVKDMIVSGGENIYSVEIERAIADHPGVADVAVIAVPSERWGETPKAFVVPAAGGPAHHRN
ncbi:MAG: AMP-binding protein, partial [Ilumatobacteraceae bacterium]